MSVLCLFLLHVYSTVYSSRTKQLGSENSEDEDKENDTEAAARNQYFTSIGCLNCSNKPQ